MNLKEHFERALTYDEYIAMLDKNLPLHELHYKKFMLDETIADEEFMKRKYRILVITEPWCGDSLALIPLVRKLSESANEWHLKFLLRDQNQQLIDQFLTNGSRAIPIFLFLDENYDLHKKWGPRPELARQIYEDHRAEIKSGQIEKQDVIKKIRAHYAKDRGKNTLEELKALLHENNFKK